MPIPSEKSAFLFDFFIGERSCSEIEEWVYSANLEDSLNEEEHLELISLNFNADSARSDVEKILRQKLDSSAFITHRLRQVLERILERKESVQVDILEIYNLYCRGYGFLQKIALKYGLDVACPTPRSDSWDDLSLAEQTSLIDSFYPEVAEDAQLALACLERGDLDFEQTQITNYLNPLPDDPVFEDRRPRSTKKKMSIKTLNLNNPIVRWVHKLFGVQFLTYKYD